MNAKERQDLLARLEKWHERNKHSQVIETLDALPVEELDYELTNLLARALNNLAQPGKMSGREMLSRAERLLRSVAEQGAGDPLWHYRLGYSLFYLDREEESAACLRRALELDPDDEVIHELLALVEKYLPKRHSESSGVSNSLKNLGGKWG